MRGNGQILVHLLLCDIGQDFGGYCDPWYMAINNLLVMKLLGCIWQDFGGKVVVWYIYMAGFWVLCCCME